MKKPGIIILLLVNFSFLSFLGGFYLGRNLNDSPIRVSTLPNSVNITNGPTDDPVPELININTATKEELETLPGIGPSLAQLILDYIQENGPFETLNQLTQINGIGPVKLNGIMDYATVGG